MKIKEKQWWFKFRKDFIKEFSVRVFRDLFKDKNVYGKDKVFEKMYPKILRF